MFVVHRTLWADIVVASNAEVPEMTFLADTPTAIHTNQRVLSTVCCAHGARRAVGKRPAPCRRFGRARDGPGAVPHARCVRAPGPAAARVKKGAPRRQVAARGSRSIAHGAEQ